MLATEKRINKRKPRSLADISAEIAMLKKQQEALNLKFRDCLEQMIERSGLLDVSVNSAELEAALKEVAGRFRRAAIAARDPNQPPSAT
jgi:TraC-like protein